MDLYWAVIDRKTFPVLGGPAIFGMFCDQSLPISCRTAQQVSGTVLRGHFPPCAICWPARPVCCGVQARRRLLQRVKVGAIAAGIINRANASDQLLDTGTPVADWMRARMKKFARAENLRAGALAALDSIHRREAPPILELDQKCDAEGASCLLTEL